MGRKKGDKRGLRRNRVRDRVGWILEGEGGGVGNSVEVR